MTNAYILPVEIITGKHIEEFNRNDYTSSELLNISITKILLDKLDEYMWSHPDFLKIVEECISDTSRS